MTDPATGDARRFAVYFAPSASHPLWRVGCAWLGRDPADVANVAVTPPARSDVADPWRYGFHATLKAPMRLAAGANESAWVDAVARVARTHRVFALPALEVADLADFIALRPAAALVRTHPLWRLADDCVIALDAWRAASTQAERTRQMKPGLNDRQRSHVERHGYAFVLDDWRFHMTLSDSLPAADPRRARLRALARDHFKAALAEPLLCEDLCVFVEPAPGQPFLLRHRLPLATS